MLRISANIRGLSRPTSSALSVEQKLKDQITAVLIAMSGLCGLVAATAFFVVDAKAMFAALMGGLSQIAAVWAYGRVARSEFIPAPKTMLAQFMLAELVKLVLSLALLLVGVLVFGSNAWWFVCAFVAALAAYLLVLLRK